MKFIPVPGFAALNSVLSAVEALGCLVTVRVEAFSCRKSKEEKKTAQLIAQHLHSSSEPNSSSNNSSIGPMGMGFPAVSYSSDVDYPEPVGPATVDDRFLFLISALNAIHGEEYDFTVLSPSDFVRCDPYVVMQEVDTVLHSMPNSPFGSNPHDHFWQVLSDQLLPSVQASPTHTHQPLQPVLLDSTGVQPASIATECEFFKFCSPTCDPLAQEKLWSHHLFLYSRRMKLMVSIMCYGDGNRYRGDDFYQSPSYANHAEGAGLATDGRTDSPMVYCEPEGDDMFPSSAPGMRTEEDDEDEYYYSTGKNRSFYGFGGGSY